MAAGRRNMIEIAGGNAVVEPSAKQALVFANLSSLSGRSITGNANQRGLTRNSGHSHQAGISLPSGDQICTLPITKRLDSNAGMRERLIRKSC
jgi:hypothetical protein